MPRCLPSPPPTSLRCLVSICRLPPAMCCVPCFVAYLIRMFIVSPQYPDCCVPCFVAYLIRMFIVSPQYPDQCICSLQARFRKTCTAALPARDCRRGASHQDMWRLHRAFKSFGTRPTHTRHLELEPGHVHRYRPRLLHPSAGPSASATVRHGLALVTYSSPVPIRLART